jgi:hypothetical protein
LVIDANKTIKDNDSINKIDKILENTQSSLVSFEKELNQLVNEG